MLRIVQNIHVETAYDGLSQVHCLSRAANLPERRRKCAERYCACVVHFREYRALANETDRFNDPREIANENESVKIVRMHHSCCTNFNGKCSQFIQAFRAQSCEEM